MAFIGQEEKGLYTSPTLLAGDIDTGRAMLLTGNMEPVAEKKFQVREIWRLFFDRGKGEREEDEGSERD